MKRVGMLPDDVGIHECAALTQSVCKFFVLRVLLLQQKLASGFFMRTAPDSDQNTVTAAEAFIRMQLS